MTGKELINYLVLTGKIAYDGKNNSTYKEEYVKECIDTLNNYKGEVGVRYELFSSYFGDIYNPYRLLNKFKRLVIDFELNDMELEKLISNVKFLGCIGVCKKDTALTTIISNLDEAKRDRKSRINEFTIPIGTKHYYNLKTLNKRISYQLNFSSIDKVCIGKIIGYNCINECNHVKYIMYDFDNHVYDIVRNPDFDSNRNFYKQRDKDRLKLRFVKY